MDTKQDSRHRILHEMKILFLVEAEPKLHHTDVVSERKRGIVGTMPSENIQK
jgi:hypothetical protein